jgi:hypothetical protein
VLDRAEASKEQFSKGLVGSDWKWLSMADWFDTAFDDVTGKYFWTPAPALADVALENMCEILNTSILTPLTFSSAQL